MSRRVPTILFIGQSKGEVAKLVTDVTKIECSAETGLANPTWNVDCKYYTASLNIKMGSFQTIPGSQELTEALVVLFDPKNESSLGALFAYADQLKTKKPDVCLAVCENFDDAVESYENISQFCSEYTFELIELSPASKHVAGGEAENEESTRYESAEEYGSTRVLNALLANPWTGMKRKKWTPPGKKTAEGEEEEKEAGKADEKGAGDKPKADSEVDALVNSCAGQMASVFKKDEPPKASSGASASASGSVDTGMDDLLSKLKQLKAKAAGMTDDDRKKYAERVAMSFAEATGVDE